MAMHMVKQRQKKQRAVCAALPYRSKPESLPVAEDTALAERMFGNRYEMIVIAAQRAYDILRGSDPMIDRKKHQPTVIAMLEVEAGLLDRNYQPKYRKVQTQAQLLSPNQPR